MKWKAEQMSQQITTHAAFNKQVHACTYRKASVINL